MSLVSLKVFVVLSKSPSEKGDAQPGAIVLKAEKYEEGNNVVIEVWKDAAKTIPTVSGCAVAEALFTVLGFGKLAARVGQGVAFWIGKQKTDGQGVTTTGHGVKTDNYQVINAESMSPNSDSLVPDNVVHPVGG